MADSISTTHPEYAEFQPDWKQMRDTYKGQRRVKDRGKLYLPPTAGQIADGFGNPGSVGQADYDAYKKRARFPGFLREAVQMAIGMMHNQPPEIKLPAAMEDIRSSKGETLPALLRRINEEQLITGRLGVMVDLPTDPLPGEDLPYLTTYSAERLINWDDGTVDGLVPQVLNMVVLEETEYERKNSFDWERENKYRVLILGDVRENEERGAYRYGVFEETAYNEQELRTPNRRGVTLEEIPFVIINSCDLVAEPDDPPLMDLSNIVLTIYRGDADYRQNLFMQGQDTFVISGGLFNDGETVRTGVGARIDLPIGGDAKYVGVESSGLEEQRTAQENLEARAGSMGAQTLDSTSRERESGDSMRIRVSARTANLNQIADAGAAGLEQALKIAARWMGEEPDEVSVKANKEFGEMPLTGQTMVEMQNARNLGFPISARSLHEIAFQRRLTRRTYEEELTQAQAEKDTLFAPVENGDRNPDQSGDGNGADDESGNGSGTGDNE